MKRFIVLGLLFACSEASHEAATVQSSSPVGGGLPSASASSGASSVASSVASCSPSSVPSGAPSAAGVGGHGGSGGASVCQDLKFDK